MKPRWCAFSLGVFNYSTLNQITDERRMVCSFCSFCFLILWRPARETAFVRPGEPLGQIMLFLPSKGPGHFRLSYCMGEKRKAL